MDIRSDVEDSTIEAQIRFLVDNIQSDFRLPIFIHLELAQLKANYSASLTRERKVSLIKLLRRLYDSLIHYKLYKDSKISSSLIN